MYLLKLLVFQGIQLLVRSAKDQPVSDTSYPSDTGLENELKVIVNNFYNKINENDIVTFSKSEHNCSDTITKEVVQNLENNIIYILKKLYNHYLRHLPPKNDVLLFKSDYKYLDEVIYSDYVDTICSYIPRCLDFIYICSTAFEYYPIILKYHAELCHSREIYIEDSKNSDNEVDPRFFYTSTIIENKGLNAIFKSLSISTLFTLNFETENTDDTDFIKNLYSLINKIDKKNMIKNGQWNTKKILIQNHSVIPHIPVPDDMVNKVPLLNVAAYHDMSKIQALMTLMTNLNSMVKQEGERLKELYGVVVNDINFTFTFNLALEKILDLIIKGISQYFRKQFDIKSSEITEDEKNNGIDIEKIEYLLSTEFIGPVCQKIPFYLFHLSIDAFDITTLLSSYLIMCSYWVHFLNVRCKYKNKEKKVLYNFQCVQQSVKDKLLLNNFMIKGNMNFEEAKFSDQNHLQSMLNKIHDELLNYYKFNDCLIWTSIDWLIEVHIFSNRVNSDFLNEIKYYGLKNNLYNEEFPFINVYNHIIPWNLNAETLKVFKQFTCDSFINNFIRFIKQKVSIINFYYKLNINVEDNTKQIMYERLNKSVDIYKEKLIYLHSIWKNTNMDTRKIKELWTLINIIKNIENIDMTTNKDKKNNEIIDNTTKSDKDKDNNILKELENISNQDHKFSTDLENLYTFLYDPKTDFTFFLNIIYVNNCQNSINYLNTYFSILKNSKLKPQQTEGPSDDFLIDICTKNDLDNIFMANKSTDTVSGISGQNPEGSET